MGTAYALNRYLGPLGAAALETLGVLASESTPEGEAYPNPDRMDPGSLAWSTAREAVMHLLGHGAGRFIPGGSIRETPEVAARRAEVANANRERHASRITGPYAQREAQGVAMETGSDEAADEVTRRIGREVESVIEGADITDPSSVERRLARHASETAELAVPPPGSRRTFPNPEQALSVLPPAARANVLEAAENMADPSEALDLAAHPIQRAFVRAGQDPSPEQLRAAFAEELAENNRLQDEILGRIPDEIIDIGEILRLPTGHLGTDAGLRAASGGAGRAITRGGVPFSPGSTPTVRGSLEGQIHAITNPVNNPIPPSPGPPPLRPPEGFGRNEAGMVDPGMAAAQEREFNEAVVRYQQAVADYTGELDRVRPSIRSEGQFAVRDPRAPGTYWNTRDIPPLEALSRQNRPTEVGQGELDMSRADTALRENIRSLTDSLLGADAEEFRHLRQQAELTRRAGEGFEELRLRPPAIEIDELGREIVSEDPATAALRMIRQGMNPPSERQLELSRAAARAAGMYEGVLRPASRVTARESPGFVESIPRTRQGAAHAVQAGRSMLGGADALPELQNILDAYQGARARAMVHEMPTHGEAALTGLRNVFRRITGNADAVESAGPTIRDILRQNPAAARNPRFWGTLLGREAREAVGAATSLPARSGAVQAARAAAGSGGPPALPTSADHEGRDYYQSNEDVIQRQLDMGFSMEEALEYIHDMGLDSFDMAEEPLDDPVGIGARAYENDFNNPSGAQGRAER